MPSNLDRISISAIAQKPYKYYKYYKYCSSIGGLLDSRRHA